MRTRVGRLGLMEILAIIELRTTSNSAWIVELGAVFDFYLLSYPSVFN